MSGSGTQPLTWVVGAGGLLGSGVAAAAARRGDLWIPPSPVPWGRPEAADAVARLVEAFAAEARGGPWQVAWCAGAGVTGSSAGTFSDEEALLRHFLTELGRRGLSMPEGGLFLASSAGAVYAGASGAPFTETSPTRPLAPYGHAKLRLEELVTRTGAATGLPTVVGRISNLYGPAQNLAKGQGLISHICRAFLLRRPLSVFVPLDTVRDYLHAGDAGALVLDSLSRARAEAAAGAPAVHTKILASGQSVTVGFLIAEFRRIAKRAPQVVFGSSATSVYQARDLRLRSVVWPELDRRQFIPLPVGMREVLEASRVAVEQGRLA